MGFLDNLLNKEARKILTSVVDSVVDNVTDSIKDSLGASGASGSTSSASTASAGAVGSTVSSGSTQSNASSGNARSAKQTKSSVSIGRRNASGLEGDTGDDEYCHYDISVIRSRIEKVAAQDWPSYELRRDIPAAEVGGGEKDQGFDYGLYLNGQPKLMIMILDQYQHRNKCVQRSHKACKDRGIGSFHLLVHLPNRKTYIAERMKECMPN
ncbi:MAG: hypothetical protein IJ794_13660 [Lachnospiraceae bacterium]|nr:hypothetical protein [Lachnospiraceae bacterium]